MKHSATDANGSRRLIADSQAALRRVATLVARGATSSEVFAAVANEVSRVLDVPAVMIGRYEADRMITVLAAVEEPGFETGSHRPLDGPSVSATVLETGMPARIDGRVGAPITVDGKLWGVITIGTRDGEPCPPDTEARLAEFGELAASAISNAALHERLEHVADEQAALSRVATLVAEGASTPDLGAAVLEEAIHVLDVPAGWLVRYESPKWMTVVAAIDDGAFPHGSRWPLDGESLVAKLLRTGVPARIDDYSELESTIAAQTRTSGFVSAVGVPIKVDGGIWGVVCVGTFDGRPLPPDMEDRLAKFTELVAISIANAESRDRLRALADEREALRRVATLVAEAAPGQELFDAVAREVGGILELPGVRIVRYDAERAATILATAGEVSPAAGPTISAPIVVDGATWGAIIAVGAEQEPIPDDSVIRLRRFTQLVATAVSNLQAHDDLRGLADEQAALRRVATLVAEGAEPVDVFEAVCAEAGRLLAATSVNLSHYTPDGFNVTMAGWSVRGTHVPSGARFPITSDTLAGLILRTRAPARMESWDSSNSELAELVRSRGVRSSLAAPVMIAGRLWGALVAATDTEDPMPPGAEARLARFTALIATAISNAATRSDLIASRARIVAAGDEARRRIERNLHDGTQQRLIAVGLDLQRIRTTMPDGQSEVQSALETVEGELAAVLEDVRELSRGLHPPSLSRGGLSPSLRALTRRSPIPVRLEIALTERPAAAIETALYFAVSEALTNAIKHSQASTVSITITTDHPGEPFGIDLSGGRRAVHVHATIADDGVGGAALGSGSGLTGMVDRIDALGGRLELDSPPHQGTRLSIELPLEPVSPG